MKKTEKIIGFHSGHDCSYCVLKDGVPIIHNELERFSRKKEHLGDALEFLFQSYDGYEDIKYFCNMHDGWKGGITERYPDTFKKMNNIIDRNKGKYYYFGHHQTHAANAFYSSNFDDALIITIDAGGWDFKDPNMHSNANYNEETIITTFTISLGKGTKIDRLHIKDINEFNIGATWNLCLENIFNLPTGYPYGNQAGTIMAMACMGDSNKYFEDFKNGIHNKSINTNKFQQIIKNGTEQDKFNIAAAIQRASEEKIKEQIDSYIKKYKPKNLCLAGGVSLNSVLIGKLYEWYEGTVENIYVPPVPYDAGLAIGACQILWHDERFMNQPRVKWEDNSPTYLGYTYHEDSIFKELENNKDKIKFKKVTDDYVVDLLTDNNVISIFGEGSESGRRALGNRSILADPRNPQMKDIINKKVKHRQWFRPFAPSILKEDVKDWFEYDISSPYMTAVIKFKEEVREKVPAVVHFDGSARLQTVTKNDNKWYYSFINKFKQKTGIPIVLNTSFNDREPIVETPEHAINCFLGTSIDYLYFRDVNILVERL